MDKISIVVPVYNVKDFVSRCIDSLIGQSYRNIEILLIDDGSRDGSGEICDSYAKIDDRITVFHNDNQGVSYSRNYGFDRSTGDYICFLDSDDYYATDFCEKMHDVLIKENADIAICSMMRFKGEYAEAVYQKNDSFKILTSYEAIKKIYSAEGEFYTITSNKLFRRNVIDDVRYPLGKINEDEFITYKFFLNSKKIIFIDKPMYFYFKNENSITAKADYFCSTDIYDALDERKIIFQNKGNLEELVKLTDKAYLDRIIYRRRFLTINEAASEELFKRYRKYFIKNLNNIPGIGYILYFFSPKLYYFLLNALETK